jgi:hypothetical protein
MYFIMFSIASAPLLMALHGMSEDVIIIRHILNKKIKRSNAHLCALTQCTDVRES